MSNFAAYSCGTGAEAGSASDSAKNAPVGLVSSNRIVYLSGVVIPAIGFTPAVGLAGAPFSGM